MYSNEEDLLVLRCAYRNFMSYAGDRYRLPLFQYNCRLGERGAEMNPHLEMAIIGPGAPTPEFSTEFLVKLRKALIIAMDADEDEPIPRFDKFELSKQKYIRVVCANKYSKRWLIKTVMKLSPFERTSLLVVKEDVVPVLRPFYVYFPYLDDDDTTNLLSRMNRSTPYLKTESWKIRESKRLPNEGSVAMIEIDTSSIRLIEDLKYSVHVGMGWARFWDPMNNKGHLQAAFSGLYFKY